MQKIKYFLLPIAFMCFNNAIANDLPAKKVDLPFYGVPIVSKTHSALTFNYDMSGTPAKTVVCKLKNIYKSWLEFSDRGTMRESGTYGNYQTVILTSTGETHEIDETTDMFHADQSGNVNINDLRLDATASCWYEIVNSSK